MADTAYHLIDNNTGEEVYASDDFRFGIAPAPEHQIRDAVLMERYGGPAIIDRVEDAEDGSLNVYIDGVEEQLNDDNVDPDQSYRRS